jgi:hypothetical protein
MSETSQRAQILAAQSARGWDVSETLDTDWWADEMLVLTLKWAPAGTRLVITFLVDPQHDGRRASGESVWAVVASIKRATGRAEAEAAGPLLALGKGWESRLAEFVQAVDALRD